MLDQVCNLMKNNLVSFTSCIFYKTVMTKHLQIPIKLQTKTSRQHKILKIMNLFWFNKHVLFELE